MKTLFSKKYTKLVLLTIVAALLSVGVTITSCEVPDKPEAVTPAEDAAGDAVEDAVEDTVEDAITVPEVLVTPDTEESTDVPETVAPDDGLGLGDYETTDSVPGC